MISKQPLRVAMVALMVCSLATIGCDQGFTPNNDFVQYERVLDSEGNDIGKQMGVELDEADTQAVNEALKESLDALIAVEDIQDDISSSILKGLNKLLDKTFGKLIDKMDEVRAKLQDSRDKVAEFVSKLDPNQPGYDDALEQANKVLESIDKLDEQISEAMLKIVDKLDVITDLLDRVSDRLSGGQIWQIILVVLVQNIKDDVVDFKAELMARI